MQNKTLQKVTKYISSSVHHHQYFQEAPPHRRTPYANTELKLRGREPRGSPRALTMGPAPPGPRGAVVPPRARVRWCSSFAPPRPAVPGRGGLAGVRVLLLRCALNSFLSALKSYNLSQWFGFIVFFKCWDFSSAVGMLFKYEFKVHASTKQHHG